MADPDHALRIPHPASSSRSLRGRGGAYVFNGVGDLLWFDDSQRGAVVLALGCARGTMHGLMEGDSKTLEWIQQRELGRRLEWVRFDLDHRDLHRVELPVSRPPRAVFRRHGLLGVVTKRAIHAFTAGGELLAREAVDPQQWRGGRFFCRGGRHTAAELGGNDIGWQDVEFAGVRDTDIRQLFDRRGQSAPWGLLGGGRLVTPQGVVIDLTEIGLPDESVDWLRFEAISADGRRVALRGVHSFCVDLDHRELSRQRHLGPLDLELDWDARAAPPGKVPRRLRSAGLDRDGHLVVAGHPTREYFFNAAFELCSRPRSDWLVERSLLRVAGPGRVRAAWLGDVEVRHDELGILSLSNPAGEHLAIGFIFGATSACTPSSCFGHEYFLADRESAGPQVCAQQLAKFEVQIRRDADPAE